MRMDGLATPVAVASIVVFCASCVASDDTGTRLGADGEAIVDQDIATNCKVTGLVESPTGASVTPGTSIAAGTKVAVSWSGSCVTGTPKFIVYEKTPTTNFAAVGNYSAATTAFQVDTTGLASGTYGFQIWVSSTGVAGTKEGASATTFFNVTGGAVVCSKTTFSVSPASPVELNAPVMMTASDSGGATSCDYRFYEKDPGATKWNVLQDYSSSAVATFTPTIETSTTTYSLQVWGRAHGTTGTVNPGVNGYDSVSAVGSLAAVGDFIGCSGVVLGTPLPTGTSAVGTKITLSATPTCPSGAAPLYQWWIQRQGQSPASAWFNLGGYASPSTVTWDTTGKAPGTYGVQVFLGLQSGATVTLQKASSLKMKILQ